MINTSYVLQLQLSLFFFLQGKIGQVTSRRDGGKGVGKGADNVFHQVESTHNTHTKGWATNFHIMLKSLNPFSVKARVESSRVESSWAKCQLLEKRKRQRERQQIACRQCVCVALLKKRQSERGIIAGVAFGKLWICALHACNVQKLRLMPH